MFFLLTIIKQVLYFIFRLKPILSKGDKHDNKVKRIGPHIEIFQVFRKRNKLITKNTIKMVTVTQAQIRGWLERKRFQRIRVKVKHTLNIITCFQF